MILQTFKHDTLIWPPPKKNNLKGTSIGLLIISGEVETI